MKKTQYNILDYNYLDITEYLLCLSAKRKVLITYYNFSTYELLRNNPSLHSEIVNSLILHVDGNGAYYFSKALFDKKLKNNINGSNLYPVLVNKLISSGEKIFVIFPMHSNLKHIEYSIKSFFKDNNVLVDFAIYNDNIQDELLKKINDFDPYAVFVGLGQPYQELWVLKNKDAISPTLIVCSGSGFEFLLNQKKRAPDWFQKYKIEWVYRLYQEPARLWKRYLLGIPVFMFHVFVQKAKLMLKKD